MTKTATLLFGFILLLGINNSVAQEKVSVRTDRDIYFGGEEIWISLSCFDSKSNNPSKISSVVYVEILNDQKSPIIQTKVQVKNGHGSTVLNLPDTISTGNYLLRAYTSWMKNLNPELYFRKGITIINPFSEHKFPEKEFDYSRDTAIFYPEGGQLVVSVENNLLVHLLDRAGEGIQTQGIIQSLDGDTIDSIETDKNGFAKVVVNPVDSTAYQICFNHDSKSRIIELPPAKDSLCVLQLRTQDQYSITFQITGSNNFLNRRDGKMHIITPEGVFIQEKSIRLENETQVRFDKSQLPPGNLCALLLDDDNEIIGSRYFFSDQEKIDTSLYVEINKSEFNEREKVDLFIKKQTGLIDVSVSVVKSCLVENCFSTFELPFLNSYSSSKLNNFVTSTISYNDLLMTLSPVKAFFLNNTDQISHPEPYHQTLQGVLLDKATGSPIPNKNLLLSFVGNMPDLYIAVTDTLGRFLFEINQFGRKEIVIQPLDLRHSKYDYSIQLHEPFSNKITGYDIPPLSVTKEKMNKLNQSIINSQIHSLFTDAPQRLTSTHNSVPFYGRAEYVIDLNKFIELRSMEEIIREIVPSTQLHRRDGVRQIELVGYGIEDFNNSFIMVDGVPVWDHEEVLKIKPDEIQHIEVLNLDYYLFGLNLGPILSIVTKKANLSAMTLDSRIFRQAYDSYAFQRLFAEPQYHIDSIRNSNRPDFRNTLYWNPNVEFNGRNEAELSFYTADEATNYTIIVEGINQAGANKKRIATFTVVAPK